MTGTVRVLRGDARSIPLDNASVDLVVTSPPYFALRSYTDGGQHYAGQIGDEPTPAQFIAALLEVTRECMRVLKPSGSLWVNLGDKYAQDQERSRNGNGNRIAIDGFTGGKPIRDEVGTVTTGRKSNGVPRKSLIGIPWRYALACIDDLGLILRAEVIWSKPNGLPESVTDRVRRSHEQWFHFTLSPRYYSAVDEIREPHLHGGNGTAWADRKAAQEVRGLQHSGAMGSDNRMEGNPLGKLPGSVWTVPTEPLKVPEHLGVDHFAAFPSEFPKRIIQGWSPAGVCTACGEGRRPVSVAERRNTRPVLDVTAHLAAHGQDGRTFSRGETARTITGTTCACPDTTAPTTPGVVLDPFGGTGTTAHVAAALGRTGISLDLSADYCRLAEHVPLQRDRAAKVLGVAKPAPQLPGQADLFDLDGDAA